MSQLITARQVKDICFMLFDPFQQMYFCSLSFTELLCFCSGVLDCSIRLIWISNSGLDFEFCLLDYPTEVSSSICLPVFNIGPHLVPFPCGIRRVTSATFSSPTLKSLVDSNKVSGPKDLRFFLLDDYSATKLFLFFTEQSDQS